MSRGKPTAADRRRQLIRLIESIERLVNEEKSDQLARAADDCERDGDPLSADQLPDEEAIWFVDARGRTVKRYLSGQAAHHVPHEDAIWFVDAVKRYLSGKAASLENALGLKQRGKPFDPAKSKNLPLAEKAFHLRRRKLGWNEIAAKVDPSRRDAVDDRSLRKMVDSHLPAIYRKVADKIVRRRRRSDSKKQPPKNRQRSGPHHR